VYCFLNAAGLVCAAGNSPREALRRIRSGQDCLTLTAEFGGDAALPLGLCHGELPEITLTETHWHSRNNRLALAALAQIADEVAAAIRRFGADRVGVVIGTSTSGVADNEQAMRQWRAGAEQPEGVDYARQEMGATAAFLARQLDLNGPVYTLSTACSSGAKALASARRLLRAGVCDAVIAGGVDSLSSLTVSGFGALEAVSKQRCNPFSVNRNGINIGEGAALFLVTAEPGGVELLGVGEGSDAHHISAPDPSGAGAERVMRAALQDAGLDAGQIDYINLHGTATPLNDSMEAQAVHRVFGLATACSSTKPFTGHALGAAGAIEAALCRQLLLEAGNGGAVLPLHAWDGQADPALAPLRLAAPDEQGPVRRVLSNSFAFGGNNIALILGRTDEAAIQHR